MLQQSRYIEEAKWIADLVIDKLAYTDKQLPIRIDCLTGKILDARRLVEDLGDYVQYIYYLGKTTDNQKLMDFALESTFIVSDNYQNKTGIFDNVFKDKSKEDYTSLAQIKQTGVRAFLRQTERNSIDWNDNADVFYGLSSLYFLSSDAKIGDILLKYQRGIKRFMHNSGYLYGSTKGPRKYISRTPATFVEGLLHSYLKNQSMESLSLAKKLVSPWLNSDFFKRYGLFPSNMLINQSLMKFNNHIGERVYKKHAYWNGFCGIQKVNTNLLHGILELQKVTKDIFYETAIRKWINSYEEKMYKYNLYGDYNVFTRKVYFGNKGLNISLAVLGFYADSCKAFNDEKILSIIENRVTKILDVQSKLGFFRDSHDPLEPKYKRGFLDMQTDMSVVLIKTFCLTKNRVYLEAAKICIDSIIKHLKRPFGYIEYFNADTGAADYHSRMFIKMLTLFLKALLLLDAALNDEDVFDGDLFIISGDR